MTDAVSPSDPLALLAALVQFGPSPDRSNERDLGAAIDRLIAERDALAKTLEPGSDPALISRIIIRSIENGVRAEAAEAELVRMRVACTAADKALKPLSDAVFNDNGDMTVSAEMPSYDECIAAYFASRKVRAAIIERLE